MSYSIEIKTLDELWASLLVGSKELLNEGTKFVNFDEIMEFYNSDPIRTLPTSLNSRESLNQLVYYYLGVGSKQSVNDAVILSNILFNIVFLEYAMVCKVATGRDFREPCIGRTFHWSADGSSIGGTVESYRDETVRADIIRVRHDVDELVLYPQAGHLLSNITT